MTSSNENLWKFLLINLILNSFNLENFTMAQQTNIVLQQGNLVGLKIFPDSSRTAVYAFLGIPYAQPPIGDLRFAHPKPHLSWNGTWQAVSLKPICPQLSNTIYDETTEGSLAPPARMDEDCLYLNVWAPESGLRYGNLPVLVVITGEEMSYDWPRNRATGLDFAAEGVVVVSVQYRSNIFGWIATGTRELDGNYGLRDQELALQWIKQNIKSFGGDPLQVTLLGHGTSGATCALAHALTWQANEDALFSKLILMSGGSMDFILDSKASVEKASLMLIEKLGCQFETRGNSQAKCLRAKSTGDLLKAFESIYEHGNGTLQLGPVVAEKWREYLLNKTKTAQMPPLIIGITTNEGAFLQDYWLELAREGYVGLRSYVNNTILPKVLRYLAPGNLANRQLIEALNWRYFSGEAAGGNVINLLAAMQKLISESFFERAYYNLLQMLTASVEPKKSMNNNRRSDLPTSAVYAYIFEVTTSMDMRGRLNLFGGTSHSADLPFLLGPSLFQQISRRRFSAEEDKLCRKARAAFVNFIKNGNPTPGRSYDAWLPFTSAHNFIYKLGESIESAPKVTTNSQQPNLPEIEKLLQRERSRSPTVTRANRNEYSNPYQLTPVGRENEYEQNRNRAQAGFGAMYFTNRQDSGYGKHLRQLHEFWQLIAPNSMSNADGYSAHIRLMEATADASRYKQGFYAMLGLVCALLAILCLCVYLLRRDPFAHGAGGTTSPTGCNFFSL